MIRSDIPVPAKLVDVNIIGGGMSGVAHAVELIKAGVQPENIRIVEALNRFGGRLHTISYGGRLFEAGARWMHGGKKNLVYNWLQQEGLKHLLKDMFNVQYFSDLFVEDRLKQVWSFDSSGGLVLESLFRYAGDEATEREHVDFQNKNPGQDVPLAVLAQSDNPLVRGRLRQISSTWMGNTLDRISKNEVFSESAGSGGMQFRQGGEVLIQALTTILQGLGVNLVPNHQVKRLAEDLEHNFVLECETPQGPQSLHSKAVFLTTPIRVLQKKKIKVEPELSAHDQEIINSMDMANLGRVCVPMRHRFFKDRPDIKLNTRIDDDRGEFASFVHCRPAGEHSFEVVGFNVSVSDLSRLRTAQIFKAYPDFLKAEPLLINWGDTDAEGTYSICKVGAVRHQNINRRRLVIGGEAFVFNHEGASTLEGAVLSAQRAAEYLAKMLGIRPPATKWYRAIRPVKNFAYRPDAISSHVLAA